MENELKDKEKVDRATLNSWFINVQRARVKKEISILTRMTIK